ncbi:MAG: winged helix-turn-helix domain-containing protein [Candidatus Micrarchaeota archaeon]
MQRSEWIYRELLYQRIEKGQFQFTQLAIAKKLGISLSTVNYALRPTEEMGAIRKTPMGFRLIDPKKLLLFWASKRNLSKNIIYQTRVDTTIKEIEKNMPQGVVYTAYSAYKFKFDDVPADYSEIYVYADDEVLKEFKRQFPKKDGPPNLIMLEVDSHLNETTEKSICSIANMFVDLWNINSWYAKEFLQALEKKIDGVLA